MPMVKGLVFKNALRELTALEGAAVAQKVVEQLSPELRDGIRLGTITPGTWVPLAWQREFAAVMARCSKRGPAVLREIGKRTIAHDMSGVYRVFTRLLGPERLLSVSSRFFNQYYDRGTARIVESRKGFVIAEWVECEGFDEALWSMVIGGCEAILEGCNAEQVRIHVIDGGGNNDQHLRLRGHWV